MTTTKSDILRHLTRREETLRSFDIPPKMPRKTEAKTLQRNITRGVKRALVDRDRFIPSNPYLNGARHPAR